MLKPPAGIGSWTMTRCSRRSWEKDRVVTLLRRSLLKEGHDLVAALEQSDPSSFELRASVNVLIDHAGMEGAPVVYEDHPSYANLLGRIDHLPQFGSLVAGFTLIRPSATSGR